MSQNTLAKLGLIASLLVAIGGQSAMFPEGWNHSLSVAGAIGATLSAWLHNQKPTKKKEGSNVLKVNR